MPSRSQLWIALAVVLAATVYFFVDVRQRARIDRGTRHHRTDFTVYQYAARALAEGSDPYEAVNPRGYRYVYPPLLAVLLLPIAGWQPPNAALVFFVVSAGALLFSLVALARFRPRPAGPALGWVPVGLALVTCLGFAHQGFQRGQVTHVLLGLHVGALLALWRGRPALAGALLALGGALRLTPLLVAAGVGIGLLAGVRAHGWRPPLRFGAGLGLGLALGFVLVPLLALGPDRAVEVTTRWVEATRAVYAENEDLAEAYKINEWRFKNQAPRRVYGTWLGWVGGATFEKERPDLSPGARTAQDVLAAGTTLGLLLLAFLLGAGALRETGSTRAAVVFAALTLLPVLMTRYTWPTHYLLALPAVALASAAGGADGPMRRTRWILLVGTLLFYVAHARPLQWIGEAGCLVLACALFLASFLRVGLRRSAA